MPQTFSVGARSLFVTVTAWVFILLSALTAASALIQNASVASLLSAPAAGMPVQASPLLTGLLPGYLPWVVGFALAMSMATLAAAVGLLLRLDWARRAFIALLGVAIVFNGVGLWLHHEVVQSVVQSTLTRAPLPPQAADVLGGFVTATRVMAAAMTIGVCATLAWIMRRLMSAHVRQEFC